ERFDGYAVCHFGTFRVLQFLVVGYVARSIGCRELSPQVELEIQAGFLRDLVANLRNVGLLCAVEQERHLPVVHAVLIPLYQGEGKRGAHVTVVARLLPHPSGPEDIVPGRAPGDDKTLLDRDEVASVLHELETKICQVPPRGVACGIVREIVSQNLSTSTGRRVRKRECTFEGLRRRSRIGRQGKACTVIDGTGRSSVRKELFIRENRSIHFAISAQRIAR